MSKEKSLRDGIIIKGYSGFYYVWDGAELWECSLRGKFRLQKQRFLPGDRVALTILDQDGKKAVIEMVKERQNELLRPPVANVEQVIIVLALKDPQPDFRLLDRLLVIIQHKGIQPIICFNKTDLLAEEDCRDLADPYSKMPLKTIFTSSKTGRGIEELKLLMSGKISVFAGPSGVGKSSLLNSMEKGLALKTGVISEKTARGKHTTRHVELIRLKSGGLLADTPGFSQIYLPRDISREELSKYYPDYLRFKKECRFHSCLHREEPQCAVREAVEEGILHRSRYERYLEILKEIISEERRF
jgi:ribosome biogenesis GTPase